MCTSRGHQQRHKLPCYSQPVPPHITSPHSWSFQGKIFEQHLSRSFYKIFPDAVFGHSPSRWMDQDLFYNWLEQSFIPEIKRCLVPKPVLLLIDGALFISELCDENNILYTYFPNSKHLLQALNLELMGSVKTTYRQEV